MTEMLEAPEYHGNHDNKISVQFLLEGSFPARLNLSLSKNKRPLTPDAPLPYRRFVRLRKSHYELVRVGLSTTSMKLTV